MSPALIELSIPLPQLVLPLAAFVGVVALVFWIASLSGDSVLDSNVEDRLEALRRDRRQGRGGLTEEAAKSKSEAIAAALQRATEPLAGVTNGTAEQMGQLRTRLMHAGFRREESPMVFKGLQLIVAGIGLLLGSALGLFTDGVALGTAIKAVLAGGLFFFLPELALTVLIHRRKQRIFLGLPDALDLMVVCVEAGLGLDHAMRKVGEEMLRSHPTIAEEYMIANQQLQLGRPRGEVLRALGDRSGVEDLQQLASILIQADKFGSSIGQALRVQSDSMRTQRRQMAEEKASKTAVKMIIPLVLFIFPGIFVVLVGPAGITMYRNLSGM